MFYGHNPPVLWPKHVDYGHKTLVLQNKCFISLVPLFYFKGLQGFWQKTRVILVITLVLTIERTLKLFILSAIISASLILNTHSPSSTSYYAIPM